MPCLRENSGQKNDVTKSLRKDRRNEKMKPFIFTGALHGFLAVALGAFGAHALKEILSEYGAGIWDTAVQYQMFHAVGLIVIGILMSQKLFGNVMQLKWAGILMNAGIVFFSGSLFVQQLQRLSH